MPFYEDLLELTREQREAAVATPVIQRALRDGVDHATYVDFLGQAYHHVRHTCRLLACAIARCGDDDQAYVDALLDYIEEEKGHEMWILDDIRSLGGDAQAVRLGQGELPCRLMVAYAYYAIDHISPYAMLGMVHVLEGMSAALALPAAQSLKKSLAPETTGGDGVSDEGGFSYLSSHGALDQEHVAFFRDLVNGIDDDHKQRVIIDAAKVFYKLYSDIFNAVDAAHCGSLHAA